MHIPVLCKEAITYLDIKPGDSVIDATVNGGGYLRSILERNAPAGKVLGIDLSEEAIASLRKDAYEGGWGERATLVCDSFVHLESLARLHGFYPVQGIVFDLGLSSWHLEESGRGFSFLKDEPLDMRFGASSRLTADEIINTLPEHKLRELFVRFGEERFAKSIAAALYHERKQKRITTSKELADIIVESLPGRFRHARIHPATRVFQALRIAVNSELENLEDALPQALSLLSSGGRLVVISFHSLEDRIVKHFFKAKKEEGILDILTKKPVRPSEAEIGKNPRSRSAKLRAIVKK